MTSLTIAEFDRADFDRKNEDALVALWERAGLTRPWNEPRQDVRFALAAPTSTILVGRRRDDDQLVACVMVGHDGHRGAVYYVATDPDWRGHGFGREMMAAAEAWLAAKGIWKLNLLIRGDNEIAKGFYEAIGFQAQDRICMQKEIRAAEKPAAD
ncbi:ribosomal protein S18 acetylase RimI-like enzyme [Rhodopseudomonas julia]|uniref:Ribosomal protein S18 acetylase RimI-like enzyme n=1 Tax=Rhodopseudomonas julia TaxID=200617 RepID=A0ABU0C2N7_9BRAD|nr:GNAT family acetyltransferase [Rhodopseudomonas julia]MDQ0324778.1 ribosomal protein S18 acetylase RimI-like enzyme [Rhodopseudomonas julia]